MGENQTIQHWYLHVDLDAFFASVEQLDNPDLRGKPVIVGGLPEDRRSVVSTASYEARKFGVHSAMPTFQAYRLCPQGIFVRGRMHRYAELSYQIMNIFRDFSPDVDQMSIDEAFIDLTGTEKLFGPPEETAAKIKKRVKEETGLTVSMGLATTKYLAKIASGFFKPDGFCHIKAGQEQNFMLNLPLNKVWGLGPKSLELIRSKGFSTTRDIYERDYDSLEFLFGKNMAVFLYDVVRGIEKTSFSRESKSHSISAESTFPFDLTDIYLIETELLELAQGVYFRLLKEEGFSRTAFVKIRYDDFSTSTVQETLDRNINTLDTFYEVIKRLFEKRYQNGRGIRLLGVGFENIVKEERPFQQDLFENNDEKKQAVEKAILKLSKKHPEIKVQKARTLKAVLLLLLLGAGGARLEAEEVIGLTTPKMESPASLFDYDINDQNHVDFTSSGYWKTEFKTGLDFSFGNDTQPAFSPQIPLFTQEIELQTLLTLNNKWYFQADFAEQFSKNTFAFGYKSQGLIRHFRLANRGITMSKGYSAEAFGYGLTGGNNQAPGVSLLLQPENEKWQADLLVRYDLTQVKSATYYGMNKATDLTISPADFLYGCEFRFPETAVQQLAFIDSVYIENAKGSWKDSRGKNYRKLTKDEYTVLISENRLFISKDAGGQKNSKSVIPSVIVTFTSETSTDSVIAAAGNYSQADTFLGKLQTELGKNGKYKLEEYTGQLKTEINGSPALILQDNKVFSPFLCPYSYDIGKYEADVFVQAGKSGNTILKYKVLSNQDYYTSLYNDFFNEKQKSTRIINSDSEKSVYPFAEDYPEIYLGITSDIGIEIHSITYTPVKEFLIPKTASSGSVQVYKNGILLSNISFNENTGVVKINASLSPADKIQITWQEETSDFSSGALAIGTGFKLKILQGWNADISFTARQSLNQKNKYFYSDNQKNSFAALTAGTEFEKKGFKLSEKANLSLLDENTSKGLLLYCWDDIWDVYSHQTENVKAPEKTSVIRFSPADFSAYKYINIELDFSKLEKDFSPPLIFTFDEDSGTSAKGKTALSLAVKDISKFQTAFAADPKKLHNLKINLENTEITFDGEVLSKESYEVKINDTILPSRLMFEESTFSQKFYITKLSYEEAKSYGTFKNQFTAEYKKEGTILSAGNFALLKDLYFSSESSQGSGNFSNPDFYINTKSQAGLSLCNISISGQLSSQNKALTYAGHSIKTVDTLAKIIYLEDTYRKDYISDEINKLNSITLNPGHIKIPVTLTLNTSSTSSAFIKKQNADFSFDFTQALPSSSLSLELKINNAQKINTSSKTESTEYLSGWKESSLLAFSSGNKDAASRTSKYSALLSGTIAPEKRTYTFKPKLSWELSDDYSTGTSDILFTDKEFLKLTLPFTLKKQAFSFELSRTGGGIQSHNRNGSYYSDTNELFNLQNNRIWFYTQIPLYEFFDQQIASKLSYNTSYSSKYEANYRRTLYNSIKDLYIPSAITLAVDREIKASTPFSDIYQIKAIITNNSINNFGNASLKKSFSWFRQEELTTSLTSILKIPAQEPQNYRIKIQAFSQLLLYISDKANLTENFDFYIENYSEWNLRNTISYNRPSDTSLIAELARQLIPEVQKKSLNFAVTRKDSFTFEIGEADNNFRQKYEYTHTVNIAFMDYYSIFTGISGTVILNQQKADRVNISLNLGAKAEF